MTRENNTGQPSIEEKDPAATPQEEVRTQERDRLQTIEEVAQMIRFSVKSIYQLVHYRKIPYIKVSGALRFKTSDLETWLEENTFRPRTKTNGHKTSRSKVRKASRMLTDVERMVEQSRTKYLDH